MKKSQIPQDSSDLKSVGKELCYALDESGNYGTEKSAGWEVKTAALDLAWEEINRKAEEAKTRFLNGEISPIVFFMELRAMDLNILSDYTGFWKWNIKRHMKPSVFKRLSEKNLLKYAEAFDVTIENLKKVEVDGN